MTLVKVTVAVTVTVVFVTNLPSQTVWFLAGLEGTDLHEPRATQAFSL